MLVLGQAYIYNKNKNICRNCTFYLAILFVFSRNLDFFLLTQLQLRVKVQFLEGCYKEKESEF